MYRGTTPTNIFNVNVDLTTAIEIFITYEQNGENIIEKQLQDITVSATKLTVTLTQTETLDLVPGQVNIQIRAKLKDGAVIASNIIKTTAERILKEGVI